MEPRPPAEGTRAEDPGREALLAEIAELRQRLQLAEATLGAIRDGDVDAFVVYWPQGEAVYTLDTERLLQQLRVITDALPILVAYIDREMRYRFVNRSYEVFFGRPASGLRGRHMHDLLGANFGCVRPHAEQALAGRKAVYEHWFEFPGKTLCMHGTYVPHVHRGEVLGFVALIEDVTERRQAEEALRQREQELVAAKEQAEAANLAKDRFLATLSHELRTPLTPVLALVESLERNERLPGEARQALTVIRRNIELEGRLIDDLLDLTRIARGKLELHRQVVDLHETIGWALETLRLAEPAAHRLTVRTDFAPGPAPVWADPARLAQVLGNLLGNAVKFTPVGGVVAVSTRRAGERWQIAVSDTGRGIEPERLAGIFGAFEQGGPEVQRRYGGLGLGLAISRAIVELHGGELAAASAGPDQGAEFTVYLPAAIPDAEGAAAREGRADRPAAEAGPPRTLSILLVEDHPDTAEAMAELLRLLGHSVEVAGTVAAACAAGGEREFDLVLSDLGLPDGSGLEVMRQLAGRGVPGIALSGFGMEEDLRRSHEAGFRRHLTKPVSLDVLEKAIDEVARGARPASDA